MKNLAELKRYLAQPNAALRMESLEWYQDGKWVNLEIKHPNFRGVAKLQTNSFALKTDTESGASWLQFGKASEWAFDTTTNRMVYLSSGTRITYRWATLIEVFEPA
jgi:hypothetical protein